MPPLASLAQVLVFPSGSAKDFKKQAVFSPSRYFPPLLLQGLWPSLEASPMHDTYIKIKHSRSCWILPNFVFDLLFDFLFLYTLFSRPASGRFTSGTFTSGNLISGSLGTFTSGTLTSGTFQDFWTCAFKRDWNYFNMFQPHKPHKVLQSSQSVTKFHQNVSFQVDQLPWNQGSWRRASWHQAPVIAVISFVVSANAQWRMNPIGL